MQTVIRYCWHIRFFLLGAAFLLVPLTIDPHIQRGSGPETKFRVFEYLVLCILFFSIPSLFEKRRMPWFSFLSSLCLGFAGFLVIRACFDPHWHFALDHAFQLAAWLVFAVLLAHACRDWPNFRHLMFIGVLVQLPLVVYALGQVHGVDIYFDYILKKPWRWENKLISAERSQILALGNPNFYASYASLLLIWLAAFFMAARERWQRIAWVLYMAVVFYTLIFTFTRGVWLSLLFTVCVFALFLILKTACQETDTRLRGKRMLQYAMILVFVLMIVAGVYALGKVETGGPIAFMQERFAHGFTFRDTSLRARPLLWYASIQMWNEAPVFGIGLGQFGAQFIDTLYHIASTLDAERVQAVAKNMQTLFALRSHNDYLQFLAETGAVGYGWFLLLLLTFLAHAGRRVWKRGETDNPFLFACFAIVIFIALQCAFDFPLRLPATSILFSAALGGILITEQKEKGIARLTIPRILFQTLLALGILGIVLASSWVVLSHAMASHHFRKAQVRVDRLGAYSIDRQKYHLRLAENGLKRALAFYPGEGKTLLYLGNVYYYLSKVADPTLAGDYRNRAVSTLEKARETFTNEIFYHVLVQVYLDTFQTAKAQTEADILLLIKPNDEKTQAHFLAGRVARAAGRYENAAQHFEREIENNPENDLAHAYLAAIYEEQLGRFKQALRIHLERLKHNPGQILPHEKIGDLYAGPLNEPQKALPYYQRALKLAQMGERFPNKVQSLQMKINQLQTKTGGRENTSKGNENE